MLFVAVEVAAVAVALVVALVAAAAALVVVVPVVAGLVAAAAVAVAAAVVVLAAQQLAQLVSVVAGVYWEVDPCVGADVITNDSSDRTLSHIYRTHAILCGSYHPCGVFDAEISRASARNHGHSRDKHVVLVSDLFPQVVMFASHRAYD